MRTIAICSFFVLFAIVGGVFAVPSVFADHATASVSVPAGTSSPGCEATNECYIPYEVTVDVGGEVTWSNDDTAAHTVTSGTAEDGPDGIFDSSLFMAGTTFSHKFEEAGTYNYFCMVHPWMTGIVVVEAAGEEMMEEEIMVSFENSDVGEGEMMTVDVTFTDLDGNAVEHVNYNIRATIGNEVVLDDMGAHEHKGMGSHTTAPLPVAPSESMPVNIDVEFLGFGIDEPFTGPIGQVATKQVIPEFGTIAMMVLGVSIVSIIALSAKSRIMPRI